MSKFSLSLAKKLVYKLYKKRDGLVQIPLILGLVIMAVALPLVTKLTQQSTENRSKATDNCSGAPEYPCVNYMSSTCMWTGSSCVPRSIPTATKAPTRAPTATPRPSDCRTNGCPSGQTCDSDVGVWSCTAHPTATPKPTTGDCRTTGCSSGTCQNINYMAGREGSPAVYVCVTPTPVPPTATPRPYNCPSRCSNNKGCATVTYQSTDSACNNPISGTQNYTPNCSCGPVSGGDNSICQQTGCKKPNGESCSTGSDCASNICFAGKCSSTDCTGGYGNKANTCPCTYSFECDSGNCVSGKCTASGGSNPTPTQSTQHYTVYKNGSCQTSTNTYVSLTACNNDPPINNCYSSMTACESAHPTPTGQHYTVYKNGSCQTSINTYSSLTACNNDPPINNCYSSMTACESAHPACSGTCYTPYTTGQTACSGFNTTTATYTGVGRNGSCGSTNLCCTKTTITPTPTSTDAACVGHPNSTGFCNGTTYLRCEAGKVAYTLTNAAACPATTTYTCETNGDHCYTTQVNGSIPTSCLTYTNNYKQLYGSGSGTCASGLCCKAPVACTCSSGYSTSVTSCPSGSTLDTTNSLSCGSGVKCGKCIAAPTTDAECVGHANSTGFCNGTTYLRCEAGKVEYRLANAEACKTTPTDPCNGYGSSIPTCMGQSNCTWNGSACVTKPVCDKLCGSNKYGDIVCSGNTVKICQCDGTWSSTVPCASGLVCDSTATKCVAPAAPACSVNNCGACNSSNCSSNNCIWNNASNTCMAGDNSPAQQACNGTSGTVKRCVGSYLYTCISGSPQWTGGSPENCTYGCENNACKAAPVVTSVPTISNPVPTVNNRCAVCSTFATSRNNGDFDCNGTSNLTDFSIWKDLFFNCPGTVSLNDFSIWKSNAIK